MLSPEQLRERFGYDPKTGVLTRTKKVGQNCKLGPAGSVCQSGHLRVKIEGKPVYVHRIIWAMMTGKWPDLDINHANGIPNDNRWLNLREATESQNMANSRKSVCNTSGKKGVWYDRKRNTFSAQIRVDGRLIFLGRFRDIEKPQPFMMNRQDDFSMNSLEAMKNSLFFHPK